MIVGYLVCRSIFQPSREFTSSLHKSFGAVRITDVIPAFDDLAVEDVSTHKSHSWYNRPHLDNHHLKCCHGTPFCNAIFSSNSTITENIKTLVAKIDNEQQRHDFYSLLRCFQYTFDITKHNIPNTPIHHVINTIPHSPPASRPYPQPDKEEIMYKLIHEFLQARLITESHSPHAAPALLVKKKMVHIDL